MSQPSELHRLAAATVLVAFDGTSASPWLRHAVAQGGYGGVILFGSNIESDEQVQALTAELRAVRPDLIVSVDEEGGDVTRLAHSAGSPYPGNAALGAIDDPDLTRRVYRAMGTDLRSLGFTLDMAPSGDVNSAHDNPVIGTRSFGDAAELVARHTAAAVHGLRDAGIAACVKHFPGHGATNVDSHLSLPTVDAPLEMLHARELAPFRAAIAAGVPAVMTAHVRVPELTGDEPATLSRAALHGLLRTELGFRGAIVTDSMEMAVIRETVGMAEGAVLALAAGADLLCTGGYLRGPEAVEPMVEAIVAAVRDGRLAEERLVDAAARVATLARVSGAGTADETDAAVGLSAARRAVTLVDGMPERLVRPLVVELQAPPGIAAGPVPWGVAGLIADLVPGTDVRRVTEIQVSVEALLAQATDRSLVVVVRDAHRHPWQAAIVERLAAARPDVVVVEMGLPVWRPKAAAAYLATYGAGRSNALAATELLVGNAAVTPPRW